MFRRTLQAAKNVLATYSNRTAASPPLRAVEIEGQVPGNELQVLEDLAAAVPSGATIVEIGSYRGRSAVSLAQGSRRGAGVPVYAIDPHAPFVGVLGGEFGPADQAALYHNLDRAGVGDLVAVVSMASAAAASAWTDRNVGLLWIDGDHSYEGVNGDFASWLPCLRPDCVVAFHDTQVPGVQRCIEELTGAGKLRQLGALGQLAWFLLVSTEDRGAHGT